MTTGGLVLLKLNRFLDVDSFSPLSLEAVALARLPKARPRKLDGLGDLEMLLLDEVAAAAAGIFVFTSSPEAYLLLVVVYEDGSRLCKVGLVSPSVVTSDNGLVGVMAPSAGLVFPDRTRGAARLTFARLTVMSEYGLELLRLASPCAEGVRLRFSSDSVSMGTCFRLRRR